MATAQRIESLGHGHERRGTGRVYADRRAREVQLVRDARGDVVLLVGQHHLEFAHAFDEIAMRLHMLLEVRAVVHTGEHTHRLFDVVRNVAAVFQHFPADLEEFALLRIHELGFLGADAEESRIEVFDAVEHAAGAYVVRVVPDRRRDGRIQLVRRESANGFLARAEIDPEARDVVGARKAAGHADDGHGFQVRGGAPLRHVRRAPCEGLRQAFGRRSLEERGGGDVGAQAFAHECQRAQRQQRIAAELEKVVARAHAFEAEHLAENGAEGRFTLAGGRAVFLRETGP